MAHSRDKLPTFTPEDRVYFKEVLDQVKKLYHNPETVNGFIKAAYKRRFGAPENHGLLSKLPDDTITTTLILRTGKDCKTVEVKDVTFNMPELKMRVENLGYNPRHPHFGEKIGNMSTTDFNGMISQMVDYLENPTNNPPKFFYHPPRSAKKDASLEDDLKAKTRKIIGVKKKQQDETLKQRSYEEIPLDENDIIFLKDVENNLIYQGASPNQVKRATREAFTLRYSRTFLNPDGTFNLTDNNGKTVHLNLEGFKIIVRANLPELYKKFVKFKLARDFFTDPLYHQNMTPEEKTVSKNVAQRWMDRKSYKPNHATEGGEILFDSQFYNDFKRTYEYNVRHNLPSPNVKDKFPNRDDFPTLEELLHDDAVRGTKAAISILAGTKFAKFNEFPRWAKNPQNFQDWVQQALLQLTAMRTGSKDFEKESVRFKWVVNSTKELIEKTFSDTLQTRQTHDDDETNHDFANKNYG